MSDWRSNFRRNQSLPPGSPGTVLRARGRDFELILNAMLNEDNLEARTSYRPRGEEIDGAFWLDGRVVLLEAKWTASVHPASSLYQFKGKVDGKLVGTVGLFVSMAGYSTDAVDALVAGKELNVILADGEDINQIVEGKVGPAEAIRWKLRQAGEFGNPYAPLSDSLLAKPSRGVSQDVVVVEGKLDERLLEAIQAVYGDDRVSRIVRAGGLLNIPNTLHMVSAEGGGGRVILVVNGADTREMPISDWTAFDTDVLVVRLPGTLQAILGLDQIALPPTFGLVAEDIRSVVRNLPLLEAAGTIPELGDLFRLLGVRLE
jgi:hypothetical protein